MLEVKNYAMLKCGKYGNSITVIKEENNGSFILPLFSNIDRPNEFLGFINIITNTVQILDCQKIKVHCTSSWRQCEAQDLKGSMKAEFKIELQGDENL